MIRSGARQRLAGLRQRLQPANAAEPLPTSKEQIIAARKLPLAELRKLASDQIDQAKGALEKASGLDGWNRYNPLSIIANDRRWGPFADLMQRAVDALDRGDLDQVDKDKTEHYIAAWTTARLAVYQTAKEARFGPTTFLREVQGFVTNEASEYGSWLKDQADKGYTRVEKTLVSTELIVAAGIVIYLLVKR